MWDGWRSAAIACGRSGWNGGMDGQASGMGVGVSEGADQAGSRGLGRGMPKACCRVTRTRDAPRSWFRIRLCIRLPAAYLPLTHTNVTRSRSC